MRSNIKCLCGSIVGCAALVSADTVAITADRDNSMFQTIETIDASSGSGRLLYSGFTASESRRRALIRFDVAGNIPAGSTIDAATVKLWCNRAVTSPQVFSLHRVTAAWGEGESDSGDPGGTGAESQPGDASWNYRIYPTDLWTTAGGDFIETASASASIDGRGVFGVFASTAELTGDVQAWLDGTLDNHGWVLIGNEASPASAYRFDSRESLTPSQRPTLTISFTPPAPCVGDLNDDGLIGLTDLSILLANFGSAGGRTQGDLNNDGQITLSDLATLLAVFGNDCP